MFHVNSMAGYFENQDTSQTKGKKIKHYITVKNKSFIYKEFFSISDNFLRMMHQKNQSLFKASDNAKVFPKKSCLSTFLPNVLFYCYVGFKNVTQAPLLPSLSCILRKVPPSLSPQHPKHAVLNQSA